MKMTGLLSQISLLLIYHMKNDNYLNLFLLVRNVLKTFSHIDPIKDNKLEIVIINKSQYKIINNAERVWIIEDCANKLFGKVQISLKYISKEDFYQSKLNW